MTYLWIKAFHIVAITTFVGGTLTEAVLLAAYPFTDMPPAQQRVAAGVIRKWDRAVTTPAMLLAWISGMRLALGGGWFSSAWLLIKLVFVLALSGLHGLQSGMLRRVAGDAGRLPRRALHLGPLILALVSIVTILVVIKPF